MQQQLLEAVIEEVCGLVADSDGDLDKLAEEVQGLKLRGDQYATDRMHLRRGEAILLAVIGEDASVSVAGSTVEKLFNAGAGVNISRHGQEIHIEPHAGKFAS